MVRHDAWVHDQAEGISLDSFTLNKIEFGAVRRILSDFCATRAGKSLALRIGPSRSPQIVRQWLTQTTQMGQAIAQSGLIPFGGVTDISAIMAKAHVGGGAAGEDFAILASTLEGALNVKNYLAALDESLDLLTAQAGDIADFQGEIKAIRSIVEPDGSIADHASVKLADIRQRIAQITQHIHDVIYGFLRQGEVAKLLQNVTVALHDDRFVLPVKSENRGRLPGVVHRSSASGATVFIEPEACVELNNRLADLRDEERDEIQRLLNQLALRISARSAEINAAMQVLARLDVLCAKAQYARQFDMICPEITENGPLQLINARHPLLIDRQWRQEKAGVPADKVQQVVPITVRLGMDFDLLVITGSNTGGKTVSLKTVAMLVVMAQSGMHIPAARSSAMPVFREVLIDVGDEQSLEQSLSTFGAHIKRIRYILSKVDQASLVLLDELGSGTDPEEGGAIGQAVLDELVHIGCRGMITTHLGILKAYAYTKERVDNASVEFNTQTLSPTYHLQIGKPGESHAITVAQKLGMPKRIMSAARRHLGEQGKQFRKAIAATAAVREVAEEARQQAQAAHVAAMNQQDVYQAKLADLHRLQEEFEVWLATLPNLKEGDEVFIPSLNKPGRLVRLELHRQIAVVDSGSLQIEMPLSDLMPRLGQDEVRKQIADLRREILEQAKSAEHNRLETQRRLQEYQHSIAQQRIRARQFDNWLGAIARVKVGDEVPIAAKPGTGTVLSIDFKGLRATLQTQQGEMVVAIQDLFPQTGPFAPRELSDGNGQQRSHAARPQRKHQDQTPADKPIHRGNPQSKAAMQNRRRLLDVAPGQQVFVVPFNKKATLIRINSEKDLAVVQAGVFEMQLPLADIEPLRT